MEIITGVERRRRWRLEEKLRIVAEVEQPGASFAGVARRYEVSRGLLWNWRDRVRRGALVPEPMPTFLPVRITTDLPVAMSAPGQGAAPAEAPSACLPTTQGVVGALASSARVEITLPGGTCIRVGADVGLATLRRVMTAVRR
jgi:transposase